MRKKRKIKLVLIIVIIFITVLSGCGKKKKHSLTFAVGGAPNEISFFKEIIREFTQESGIKVILHEQPTDTDLRRQDLLVNLMGRENDPDVFLMDVAWIPQFQASGWLLELDRSSFEVDAFYSSIINTVDSAETLLYALPVYLDGGLLYYRDDLLKKYEFKVPATWDELVQTSMVIQEKEREFNPHFYGFVWQGAQYEGLICNFIEVAASYGGGLNFKSGNITLNTPFNINALNLMKDFIHTFKISPLNTFTEMKEEEVRAWFQNGNALFERNWPYAWSLHNKDGSMVKGITGIASLPHAPGQKSASTLGGWHIGISKFSDNQMEAFELVKYITSYSTQKKLSLNLGWNPGRKDVYTDVEIIKNMPQMRVLKEIFENMVPRPLLPFYPLISNELQIFINAALSGDMDSEESLKTLEIEISKIFAKYDKS